MKHYKQNIAGLQVNIRGVGKSIGIYDLINSGHFRDDAKSWYDLLIKRIDIIVDYFGIFAQKKETIKVSKVDSIEPSIIFIIPTLIICDSYDQFDYALRRFNAIWGRRVRVDNFVAVLKQVNRIDVFTESNLYTDKTSLYSMSHGLISDQGKG